MVRAAGLDRLLSVELGSRWRAIHDPAKVVGDLAVPLAVGGDCLVDIAVLCAELGVYGLVASDPTVSRSIDRLAADASGRWSRSAGRGRPGPGGGGWPARIPLTLWCVHTNR